jgi:hypothetical protein
MIASSRSSLRSGRPILLGIVTLVAAALATSGTHSAPAVAASPATPPLALDLAAMVIRSTDVTNQPYGMHDGYFIPAPSGAVAEYWSTVSLPDASTGGSTLASRINTTATQYVDDATAQATIDARRDEMVAVSQDPSSLRRLVDGAPVVGDDSVTTVFTPTTEAGVALTITEIEFRSGPVVASVSKSDFSGAPVGVDQVRPLADAMLAHISEVRADAQVGISHRVLRIGEINPSNDYEMFARINGVTQRFSGEPDDALSRRDAFLSSSAVEDMYTLQQTVDPAGTGEPSQLVGYTLRIFRFANKADAAAFVDLAVANALADPGNYLRPQEVPVSGFTGPARAISFDWDYGGGLISSGIRTWAQAGPFVASVESDRVGGVQTQAVAELTTAQLACLASNQPCAAAELPPTLVPPG